MPRKSYVRTAQMRESHSQFMKQYWAGVTEKEKRRLFQKRARNNKKNGVKSGRKPGDGPKKKGLHQKCPMCDTMVYHTPKQIEIKRTKCCSRKCLATYPPYIEKLKQVDKSYIQTEEYRAKRFKANTPPYKAYKRRVYLLSEEIYRANKEVLNPNNFPRRLAGVEGGYHLDHIKSIKHCWRDGWSEERAADMSNLQIIPWKENFEKRTYEPIEKKVI